MGLIEMLERLIRDVTVTEAIAAWVAGLFVWLVIKSAWAKRGEK